MSTQEQGKYAVAEALPLNPLVPGTTLFVAGPQMGGAEDLALSLSLPGPEPDEGSILVSTNDPGDQVLRRCGELSSAFDASRTGVVDCTGGTPGGETQNGARVESLSSPEDLTGMGIKFSTLYEGLHGEGQTRIRTGIVSVSTLLMYADLRTVYRFLHTISGRIASLDGVGVFLIDPESHDAETVNTLYQLCDGRIDVRTTDDGDQLRARGLSDQPDGWIPFSPRE